MSNVKTTVTFSPLWWGNFSSLLHPDWLLGPPSLLSNGYCGFFPCSKVAGAWSWPFTSN